MIGNWVAVQGKPNTYRISNFYLNIDQDFRNRQDFQLFVNDRMHHEARWPNTSIFDLTNPSFAIAKDGTNNTQIVDTDLPANNLDGEKIDWSNSRINIIAGDSWVTHSGIIESFTNNTLRIKDTYKYSGLSNNQYDNQFWNTEQGNRYWVVGNLDLLDNGNEWFFDEKNYDRPNERLTGDLYIKLNEGVNINTSNIEVKARAFAFDLENKSYITIRNIDLFGTTIRTLDSEGIHIDSVDIIYPTHFNSAYVRNTDELASPIVLDNNPYRTNQFYSGLQIKGSNNIVSNSTVQLSAGTCLNVQGNSNIIVNNYVAECNYSATYNAGIRVAPYFSSSKRTQVSGASNIIAYNTVERVGRNGIHLVDPTQGERPYLSNNTIIYNKVSRYGTILNDIGAIKIDTAWAHPDPIVVAYNLIGDYKEKSVEFRDFAIGIYLDGGTSNVQVFRNIISYPGNTPDENIAPFNSNGDINKSPTNFVPNNVYAHNTISGGYDELFMGSVPSFYVDNSLRDNIFEKNLAPSITYDIRQLFKSFGINPRSENEFEFSEGGLQDLTQYGARISDNHQRSLALNVELKVENFRIDNLPESRSNNLSTIIGYLNI